MARKIQSKGLSVDNRGEALHTEQEDFMQARVEALQAEVKRLRLELDEKNKTVQSALDLIASFGT